MARGVARYLWIAVLFLGSTLVFWGLLQAQNSDPDILQLQEPGDRDGQLVAARVALGDPARTKTPKPEVYHVTKPFEFISRGVPNYLKPPESNRIWPIGTKERKDRILAQINNIPENPKLADPSEEKIILIYNGFPEGIPSGKKKFEMDNCPVTNCWMTEDREELRKAHAVVIQSGMYSVPPGPRNPEQIWILYVLESPENIIDLGNAAGTFNWTATYRLDSTINTPYERFVPFKNASEYRSLPKRNYASGKTKKIAWFVSNCYTNNGRLDYAKELQRHISLDIYGECGTMRCSRGEKEKCNGLLQKDYKFYLAFENSNCQDYITEKFYWNALYNDVIPIVMGARPEDYAAVAPPHSYIHVDDYASPAELAEYLYTLDENDDLYNAYFSWKGSGTFIDTKYWCRLCSLVHEARNNALKPVEKFSVWYGDIQRWWNGPGVCVHPSQNGDNVAWSSWRNVTLKMDYGYYKKGYDDEIVHHGPYPQPVSAT